MTGPIESRYLPGFGRWTRLSYLSQIILRHKDALCVLQLRNEMVNGTNAMEMMCNQRSVSTSISAVNLSVKRKRSSGIFRCQMCGDIFDSAVMLRLHESCHLEERQTRSSSSRDTATTSDRDQHQDSGNDLSEDGRTSNLTAVTAVRAIIAQARQERLSKDDRGKRGEYRRYTPETRDAIVQHALRHGAHEAARTFSSSLGSDQFEKWLINRINPELVSRRFSCKLQQCSELRPGLPRVFVTNEGRDWPVRG